ncbi:hypothetical protein [Streptomyces bicolor]|uniref:hypothetical protein n=1 Tax=Streptomyces bicolor TaxID=66874 RepID=UPI0004E1648C|nr:hypothetical protein [Streptomyces bicolor]
MGHDTHDVNGDDKDQDEPAESKVSFKRHRGKEDAAPSSGSNDKSQHELGAVFESLRSEIARNVQSRIESLYTRTDARFSEVLQEMRGLGQKLELVLDALKDQGARHAIVEGRATSDSHRRHLELAQDYRRLVQQDLRILVRLLCPKHGNEGEMELTRRRAKVVSRLVETLFQPLDQPLATKPEQIVAKLREWDPGLAADEAQFRGHFNMVFRKAAEIREGVVHLPLTAHLDFGVELAALPRGHYQTWNPEPADGTRPEFLIAPAYVVNADWPQSLTTPIVFVAPAVN